MAPSATDTSGATKIDFTTFHNVINGKLVKSDKTRHGINPATKKAHFEVPIATQTDVDEAIAAGKAAFKKWSRTPVEVRRKALMSFAEAYNEYKDEFAKLLTTEQGKPLSFAQGEVGAGYAWLKGLGSLDLPEDVIEENEDRKITTRYTPLGIVAAIIPWNFPVHQGMPPLYKSLVYYPCGKIAPSVITGNTVIIKPSPFTPYCGLKLVELAQHFFPPGVVQALSGDDNLGPWLTAHPGIDKISFTGSTATGKKVMESASKTLKRITLELGGKDAAIVTKSVDIATVAPKIAKLAFLNSGQSCMALKRIYIHETIYDEFRDAMVAYTKSLKVGDGFEEGVFIGPVQNSMQYEKVRGFYEDVEKKGMKVAVGGKVPVSSGYFFNPTIVDNPKDDSKIVVEEPFGPILPILKWRDEDEVIARANDTHMGLGASVWSSNLSEAERIARQLDAGIVWINSHLEMSPLVPFGGHKQSGIGSELGIAGLKAYGDLQTLYLKKKI